MSFASMFAGSNRQRRWIRAGLLCVGAAPLILGGCSLWVSNELSGKPAGTDGGSGGESGLGGGSGSGGGGTGGTSSNTTSSESSGGSMCPDGRADCDQVSENGCEANLQHDPDNCGECHGACAKHESCKGGSCK